MIVPENTVLVLLAAGRSERFGNVGSKLEEEFLGRPLGYHVAVALEAVPFMARVAIVDGGRLDYTRYGFTHVHNDDPARGMSQSVRLGVTETMRLGAAAVVIALADMPRVTATHIYHLFDAATGEDSVVASSDGKDTKPPVLFGRAQFEALLTLEGDAGARDMVKRGRHVVTNPAELIDVDTREELEQLRELVHAPEALTRAGARRLG
ncbi:molybdenum cofactor cytidylyltransferase [Sphingomonas jinjuensis]|uniref:Molybdenum cofactor cytidylyltransferase n=1 Tax=Sphingomonas jinjuensis TaxID=535907 RepID=A0A840FDC5_9SPHN|nr:nucleotidyltransferase family protein [Sphingomonas jinjuensis]MBB4153754.1 molybdenum cofactor cytidylyltransferase [Sphingomonas jinjuensis]